MSRNSTLRTTQKRGVLSLVDKRWDIMLQSTGSLWDDILFTSPRSLGNSSIDLLDEFVMCTTMSGNNALTITFNMGRNDWLFSPSIVHSIILPNIHRIKKLTCPIHTSNDIYDFLTIPEGQFRALESIEIRLIDTWTRPISMFPLDVCLQFNALRTAPRLRTVIAHIYNGLHPNDLHVPWGQLTALDLGSTAMAPEVFLKIIYPGSRTLQEGFFYIIFSKPLRPQRILTRTKVTMYTLQKLRLRLIYPSNDTRLFSVVRFPALTKMWIEMYDRNQDWDVSIYNKLLQASKNTMRTLHLSDFRPTFFQVTDQSTQGQPGLPIRRRQRATTQHALEKVFKVIPNVDTLHLPLGLFIHMATMEKLASCNLLPQLCALGVGAGIEGGWHILSMAKSRYEHVLNISLGLGSSHVSYGTSGVDAKPPPNFIKYLYLSIPRHQYTPNEELALSEQQQLLISLGIMVHIVPTFDLPLPIR